MVVTPVAREPLFWVPEKIKRRAVSPRRSRELSAPNHLAGPLFSQAHGHIRSLGMESDLDEGSCALDPCIGSRARAGIPNSQGTKPIPDPKGA